MKMIKIYFAIEGDIIDAFLLASSAIKQCNECDHSYLFGIYDIDYIFNGDTPKNGDVLPARIKDGKVIELAPEGTEFEQKENCIITKAYFFK